MTFFFFFFLIGRPACLVGQTRFGDCIDDEWFIVFLLRELTRKFDVAVSATDNDGEFLLIESAMVLPAWIDPDNSENRVRPNQRGPFLNMLCRCSSTKASSALCPCRSGQRRAASCLQPRPPCLAHYRSSGTTLALSTAQPLCSDQSTYALANSRSKRGSSYIMRDALCLLLSLTYCTTARNWSLPRWTRSTIATRQG